MKKRQKQKSEAMKANETQAAEIMTLAYKFAAMRLPSREQVDAVFEGANLTPDATAWDDAVDEGRVQTARRILLNQGRKLFGPPSAETEQSLMAMNDPDHLDRKLDAILDVKSWRALLDVQ